MSSQLNLDKVRRETGREEPSWGHKLFPVTGTKVAGVWRERGLSRSTSQSYKSKILGCDVTVNPHHQELGMSIGSFCLACCYVCQASQWKNLEKVASALCASFLSYVWPRENGGKASNRTWLPWALQDWGIPNTLLEQATMPHGLNSPQAFLQLGSGTHQAEQASLHLTVVHQLSWIQGLTLNTRCQSLITAAMQGRNDVTWSPIHLLIWHHLFSSHQGTLSKEMNVGWNCPE
jgi:hypothetical protein